MYVYLLQTTCCAAAVAHLAICGEKFRLSLALPYDDYLPETVILKFLIRVSFTFC